VIKITETDSGRHPDPSKRFHLAQITTKDWENKIMKLISWNFDLNMEESNLQMPYNPQEDSGHLIKGMVEKRNYYYCKDFIIDLEFNIPLLQRNLDQALDFKTQNYIT
jgi:cephalosporin-C deacetylase-like acetyl esterase